MSEDCCSSPSLISVEEATRRILESGSPVEQSEVVAIEPALGRVLAEDVCSSINVPGYDNSAMDGFAVHSADVKQKGTCLPLSQRITAGEVGSKLGSPYHCRPMGRIDFERFTLDNGLRVIVHKTRLLRLLA